MRRHLNGALSFTGQLAAPTAELFKQLSDKGAQPSDLDTRTVDERYGDAFADLVHRAADPPGGARAQIIMTMNYETLLENLATTTTNTQPPSPTQAHLATCDTDLIPLIFRSESIPPDMDRSRRLVKPSQRKALVIRDQGCAHPGRTAPARRADAHHIKPRSEDGKSNLDNLILLSRQHHTLIHESE